MNYNNPTNSNNASQNTSNAYTLAPSSRSLMLALGSNIAPRVNYISEAIALLEEQVFEGPIVSSHVYETSALLPDNPGQNWNRPFLNLALKAPCSLAPCTVLSLLKNIERRLGRTGTERWSPRVIDIDILLYGDICHKTATLEIPHKELYKRPFVVVPLSEIAPDAEVAGRTIAAWASSMGKDPSLLSRGTLTSFAQGEAA
jgi:2-amino-4-hydroxy-6-hydroxymethyldihydropteridine diphosphokinase